MAHFDAAPAAAGPDAAHYARVYWDAGLRVFPLHRFLASADGARCLCGLEGCKSPGKHPTVANWQHTPHWDPDQVEAMADTGQFAGGFGVVCAGLLVVDVDPRNGGLASWERLLECVPAVAGAGLIVDTGSGAGSRHLYFRAPEGVALRSALPDFPGLDFKSAGYVVGPGSRHVSGRQYVQSVGSPDDIDDAPSALIDLLRKPDLHRADLGGSFADVSDADLADMLGAIDPDCSYDIWIRIGMALHHATQGSGRDIWDTWSSAGRKYDASKIDTHWHSFGRSQNPVTLGTLVHHAEEAGWLRPVTFGDLVDLVDMQPDAGKTVLPVSPVSRHGPAGLPFAIDGVDLTCPPGYVGEVAAWIEAQSRRPRRRLAVAAALTAVGNIAGLRYTDDLDGVTTNIFAFCVAGSRTGKESIQQSVSQIHRVAGCAAGVHGAIKSEQEIVKNLVRHQAAWYCVDEIGIFLQKVKNAQTRGGAIYLDGVIGMLMSAYSKAAGYMLLTGDLREEVRADLTRQLASARRQFDETGDQRFEQRAQDLERAIDGLEHGLERPLLSLIGFTTPVTFDQLVDYSSATNGFIGRALIFREPDTAPRSKRDFVRSEMTPQMAATLAQIYSPGEYGATGAAGSRRIEYYGDRAEIPTEPRARTMLSEALDWLEDEAVAHKARTGLEALYLGGYELVSKISLILAVPGGLRTAEHVRWAFALVRADIEGKARMVLANEDDISTQGAGKGASTPDRPATDRALMARLAGIIEGDGETIGVIRNRLRKVRPEDIDRALDDMVKRGIASCTTVPARGNLKSSTLYKLEDPLG